MNTHLIVVVGLVVNLFAVSASDDAYAQGNLEVVFNAKSAKSDEDHPQKADVPNLWCQARSHDSQQLLTISEARFIHAPDKQVLPAVISNQTRAIMQLGTVSIFDAGKYKCEITTTDDDHVWGWLFVNMRPVFHVNHSKSLETDDHDHYRVKAPALRASEGETVILNCPVHGYPSPVIEWYKDDVPVASTEQITFYEKDLQIEKVEFDDEGVYSCIAKNSFSPVLDGEPLEWVSRLDRELRVRGSYRWVYPLIVIIIMLLLLFIIIYACSAFNRYKTYNVEKRERRKKRQLNVENSENSSQQQPILKYDNNELE